MAVQKGLAEDDLNIADDFFRTLPEGNASGKHPLFWFKNTQNSEQMKPFDGQSEVSKEDEQMRAMIFGQLSSKLAQKDLKGAANWAASMPVGKLRTGDQ